MDFNRADLVDTEEGISVEDEDDEELAISEFQIVIIVYHGYTSSSSHSDHARYA